jgi:hypothetical protein
MTSYLKKLLKNNTFILIFIIFLLFLYRGATFLDPDFGWHLVTGKLIISSGFPKTDPFSYTMPSFSYVDHEWLNDVLVAWLFPVIGFIGLSFIYSSLTFLAIILRIDRKLPGHFTLLFLLLGLASFVTYFAISPRVFSWVLLSLVLNFILIKKIWDKYWLIFPLLIILWANLHGSFIVGIASLGIVFIVKSINLKKLQSRELLALTLAIIGSLINPYRLKLWWEVWLNITDPMIKTRILEWQPTFSTLGMVAFLTIFLFSMSFVLISKYWRKFAIEEIILNVFFFLLAIYAIRNVPLWFLVDLPMLAKAVSYFYDDINKIKFAKLKFIKISKWLAIAFSALIFIRFSYSIYYVSNYFNEKYFYPAGAVSYIKNNMPSGQIFSEYNWGGYLIWKLPEKKVFVDGIMPVWWRNINPLNESANAMGEYLSLFKANTDYTKTFSKYAIDTVLIANPTATDLINKYPKMILPFINWNKRSSDGDNLIKKLESDNWKIVFQDTASRIYQK